VAAIAAAQATIQKNQNSLHCKSLTQVKRRFFGKITPKQ
jgi:hypothetical protein